ncbi:hypothetical protein NN561_007261 [Cricetulus griseus]
MRVWISFWENIDGSVDISIAAVSYTHLDVYKRQETIVSDVVGHQGGGEGPAVDKSFGARKMDWMVQRVEDLLEEAQTEAEEAVAEAEGKHHLQWRMVHLIWICLRLLPWPSQPLVISNSKQNAISQAASGNTFSRHSAVSMLGKGFGDVGRAKGGSTTGSQFLEQFQTAQALAQLAAQHSQSGSTTTSSWDMGSTAQSPSLVQYDLKSANDSTVHSPFTKRQAFTPSSTMMEVFLQEKPPAVATSTAAPPPPSSAKQIHLGSTDVSRVFRQPIFQPSAGSAETETAKEENLLDI